MLSADGRSEIRRASQEPLVEPVPMYPVANCTLAEAGRRLGNDYTGLSSLAAGLLAPNANLYEHQWDSLNAVIAGKKDLVVTTGTGSGKTECFLLPLLAEPRAGVYGMAFVRQRDRPLLVAPEE